MAAPDVYRVTAHAVADRPAEASAGAYYRLHAEIVRNTAVCQCSGMSPDDAIAVAVQLWDEHKQSEFPGRLRGEEAAGVDMVMLDADVAGCVATWIGNGGQLDSRRGEILAQCLADLNRVLPLLDDQGERRYYERLRELATLALGDPFRER